MSTKKTVFTETLGKFLLLTGVFVLIFAVIIFFWNDYSISLEDKIKSEKVGQFGDFVGGLIGSLWALSGVVLFYVALKEQRKDFETNREVLNSQTDALKLQLKEFELQRIELSETREIFKIQKFETTFFNLLKFHKETTSGLSIVVEKRRNEKLIESRDFSSEKFFGKAKQLIENNLFKIENQEILIGTTKIDSIISFIKRQEHLDEETLDQIVKILKAPIGPLKNQKIAYLMFYCNYKMHLSKYMQQLLSIIKYIDKSKDEIENLSVDIYIDLLKSQLIDLETKVIWIHYHTFDKTEIDLLRRYSILPNLIRPFNPTEYSSKRT